MRRSVVVQLVFEQGYFGVEQDRIWSGELGHWYSVRSVLRIGIRPYRRIGRVVNVVVRARVMSRICRRVRPVVRLGHDGRGERQVRTGVCAG